MEVISSIGQRCKLSPTPLLPAWQRCTEARQHSSPQRARKTTQEEGNRHRGGGCSFDVGYAGAAALCAGEADRHLSPLKQRGQHHQTDAFRHVATMRCMRFIALNPRPSEPPGVTARFRFAASEIPVTYETGHALHCCTRLLPTPWSMHKKRTLEKFRARPFGPPLFSLDYQEKE